MISKKMNNSSDENKVKDYFINIGLYPKKINEGNDKTPDYEVYKNGNLVFYCEVKTIKEDVFEGAKGDPIYNRITQDIHTAVKQFNSVNKDLKYPNVLVFVNHDDMCGLEDLQSVLTGEFHSEDGKTYNIYKKYSEGRIKNDKLKIHWYIWIEKDKTEHIWVKNSQYYEKLLNLFKNE